jgi:hypothetical protein
MKTGSLDLLTFLNELRRVKIYYRLSQHRDDAIMVELAVPGERWEVEFLNDGTVDVEVFKSDGTIADVAALLPMLAKHGDPDADAAGPQLRSSALLGKA